MMPKRTLEEALAAVRPRVEPLLRAQCAAAGVSYPPTGLSLLALKDERRLEVWAEVGRAWKHLADYRILAASGVPGPKLREGDRQVPEGFYRIERLNPNSKYHLSMQIDYPNAFDLARAAEEGRDNPGSEIFIHGGEASVGCLAVGDPAIEEFFTLTADILAQGGESRVIIVPHDLRTCPAILPKDAPAWLPALYAELTAALRSDFTPR